MRFFSLLFAAIALIVLAQFLIYVIRGPVDLFIAGTLFLSFLVCAGAALYLLKPFEGREQLERRRRTRREKIERRRDAGSESNDPGDSES